jgi:hypothetical protein
MTQPPDWASPGDDRPAAGASGQPPDGEATPSGHDHAPAEQGGWGQSTGYGQPPGYEPPGARYGAGPAPRPGIIPLRPIGLGEIYDGAFQAIRTNPRTMIGISALVIGVTTLISTVPQAGLLSSLQDSGILEPGAEPTAEEIAGPLAGLFTGLLLPAVVQSLAVTVLTGLLIVAVNGAVLGRRTPPGVLWARTWRRIPGLLGIAVLTLLVPTLVTGLLALPGILLLVAGSEVVGAVLIVLGVLASIPIDVLIYVRWSMAAPAMLLQERPLGASLRRSWRLVAGSTWRVLGILLLTSIMVNILAGIISVPFTVAGSLPSSLDGSSNATFGVLLTQLLISGIGQIIAGAVLYPFSAAVTALLYIDLRMRREGLDVELIRATGAGSPA